MDALMHPLGPNSEMPFLGTSLVVQGLTLHSPNARALGSIPGPRAKIPHAARKVVCATTKTQHSGIKKIKALL